MPIKWEAGTGWKPNSPSLDRLNNSNVIDKSNTWIVCYKCNATKQDRTMPDFIAYCKTIAAKYG